LIIPKSQSLNTWWEKSPHIVIESMGMSTIKIGKCESQHAQRKEKSNGKIRYLFYNWEKGVLSVEN
jgi:hypothetical protein